MIVMCTELHVRITFAKTLVAMTFIMLHFGLHAGDLDFSHSPQASWYQILLPLLLWTWYFRCQLQAAIYFVASVLLIEIFGIPGLMLGIAFTIRPVAILITSEDPAQYVSMLQASGTVPLVSRPILHNKRFFVDGLHWPLRLFFIPSLVSYL